MTGPYDALLFDFDGVLVDSEPVHHAVWQEVLRPYSMVLSWEEYERRCIGVSDRAMIQELCDIAGRPEAFDALWNDYPRKRALVRERMISAPPSFADSVALVHDLAVHVPLAVVTSSARVEVEPVLECMGIRQCFTTCVFGDEVKRLKPDPEPYATAAARLNVKRPLVVEDSGAGCASAQAAGFEFVRVTSASAVAAEVRAFLAALAL